MKNILLLSAAALLLAACGSTSTPSTPTGPGTPPDSGSTLTSLSGKVTDWNQGAATLDLTTVNNTTGASVIVGSGAIAADGSVSGTLPSAETLTAYLAPITQLSPPASAGCTGQLTFGDNAAKYSVLTEVAVKVNGTAVGTISPGLTASMDASGTLSGEEQQLFYVDRPTSVSGTSSCSKSDLSFSAQLKQGWNVLRATVNAPANGPATISLTNAASLATNWTFVQKSSTNSAAAVRSLSQLAR